MMCLSEDGTRQSSKCQNEGNNMEKQLTSAQQKKPTKSAAERIKRHAYRLGEIPRGCIATAREVWGGWVVIAEWYGSERTGQKYDMS